MFKVRIPLNLFSTSLLRVAAVRTSTAFNSSYVVPSNNSLVESSPIISETFFFNIDTTAPSLTVDSLPTLTNQASLTLSGTTSERDCTVMVWRNGVYAANTSSDSSGQWSLALQLESDTTNTIIIGAKDPADNFANNITRSVLSDVTLPIVTVSTVTTPTRNSTLTLQGTVSEANCVIIITINQVNVQNVSATGLTWSVVLSLATNQMSTLGVRALDTAQNLGNSVETQVVVDTTPPTISSVALESASDSGVQGDGITNVNPVTITFSLDEADGDVFLYVNNALVDSILSVESLSLQFTSVNLVAGLNDLSINATDRAGNQGSTTFSLTLDQTNPAVSGRLSAIADSGKFNNDAITNVSALQFDGVVSETVDLVLDEIASVANTSLLVTALRVTTAGVWNVPSVLKTYSQSGTFKIRVTVTDVAGNWGFYDIDLTIDHDAPVLSGGLASASDSGKFDNDQVTKFTTLTFSGSVGEAAALVLLRNGSEAAVQDVSSGVWQLVNISGFAQGVWQLQLAATDLAGNTATLDSQLVVDTTAVVLSGGVDSSVLYKSNTNFTKNATLVFSGSTNKDQYQLTLQGTTGVTLAFSPALAQDFSTRNWQLNALAPLADGLYLFTATATDLAGNANTLSFDLLIDTVVLSVSVSLVSQSDSSGGSRVTRFNPVSVAGSITPRNAELVISSNQSSQLTTLTTLSDVSTFSPSLSLQEGVNNLLFTATDQYQQIATTTLDITLDTIAPVLTVTTTVPLTTRTAALTISGSLSEDAVLMTVLNSVSVSNQTITGASWSVSLTLAEGSNSIVLNATDLAGNTAATSFSIMLDTVAPISVSYGLSGDVMAVGNNKLTRFALVTMSGVASEHVAVQLLNDSAPAQVLSQSDSANNGSWLSQSFTLREGINSIRFVLTDVAGNVLEFADDFVLDSIAPSITLSLSAAYDSGVSNTDRITNATSVQLQGTTTPSTAVTVSDDVSGVAAQQVNSGVDGTFTVSFASLSEGVHHFTAQVGDPAGNTASVTLTVTIDVTAPSVTLRLSSASDSNADHITNALEPVLEVLTEAGAATELWDWSAGTSLGMQQADAQGLAALPLAVADGVYELLASATDLAGNRGLSMPLQITIDTVAPVLSAFSLLDGAGQPVGDVTRFADLAARFTLDDNNATIQLSSSIDGPLGSALNGGAFWVVQLPNLSAGAHTFLLLVHDLAGNAVNATIDTFIDLESPQVTCSSDVMNTINGSEAAVVPAPSATATDNYDSDVLMPARTLLPLITLNGTLVDTVPSQFPLGVSSLMFTFNDSAGNVGSCAVKVNFTTLITNTVVDCQGSWANYGPCNATCSAYGVETSTFIVQVQPVGGGVACPAPRYRACAQDGAQCVTVGDVRRLNLSVTLSGTVPNNSAAADFKRQFTQDVASAVGISASRVVNIQFTPSPSGNSFLVEFVILDKSAVPQLETDSRSLDQVQTNLTVQMQDGNSALRNGQVTSQIPSDAILSGGIIEPPARTPDKNTDCVADILSFNFSDCWWIYAAIAGGLVVLVLLPLCCCLVRYCRKRKTTSDTLWGLDQNREKHEEYEIDFAGDGTDHQALPEIELNSPPDKQFDNDENFVIE